jgi:ADP-heptose:LPS heptosyltransferase
MSAIIAGLPVTRAPRILLLADTPSLGMKMMTTQLVRELNNNFPGSRIGVVTSESGAKFYERSPHPLTIHAVSDDSIYSTNKFGIVSEGIRGEGYDVVIAPPFQEGVYAELAINERVDFPVAIGSNRMLSALLFRCSEDVFDRYRFDHDIKDPGSIAAPQEYMGKAMLRYLEPLGITGSDMRPEAWSSKQDMSAVSSKLESLGIKPEDFVVTLNLCANQGHNQWRMATLAETARSMFSYWRSCLQDRYGNLVFLANYYEQSQGKYFGRFMTALGDSSENPLVIGIANRNPGELSSIISRSSYVITAETGTAHVAQALGVPATVVYENAAVKNGWMLPGSRVMPIESNVFTVSSDDLSTGSLIAISFWHDK